MSAKQQLNVGTRVSLLFGTRRVTGEVIEDRGPIGVGGRRLLRVQLTSTSRWSEPIVLELPESDLTVLSPARQGFRPGTVAR
jgi:hypothetical protein